MVKQSVKVYAKTTVGTDPETWAAVDIRQRSLAVLPMGDQEAVVAQQRLQRNATHIARGPYSDGYKSNRLLKTLGDDHYYMILTVREVGRWRRGASHRRDVRMQLSIDNTGHDLD